MAIRFWFMGVCLACCPLAAGAQSAPEIDFQGFAALTAEVGAYREQRRVSLDRFWEIAATPGALILDTRSSEAFAAGHIEGAVNLPFSEFTDEKLTKVIGDPQRPILIYCNNNFTDNAAPVVLKRAPLALNIPTFINLYGYGYKNVYELRDAVAVRDPLVRWNGG
jgi:phage shock protein E